jgi:hypothetical protein
MASKQRQAYHFVCISSINKKERKGRKRKENPFGIEGNISTISNMWPKGASQSW